MSLSRWNANISSPAVALAKEFSKHNRVFFIEHPYTWKDVIAGENKKNVAAAGTALPGNVTVIKPPFVVPVNFLPAGALYNWFDKINQATLLRTLERTLREHNVTSYVFINFFDPYFLRHIPEKIRPLKYVYQCMDDISQVAYTRRHGVRLEDEVIKKADVVLCTSTELVRLKRKISPRVFLHPNAADFNLFHEAYETELSIPAEILFPGKKVIGFTGSIEYRTDFALLRKVAEIHNDKMVVLVGPNHAAGHLSEGVLDLPNVVAIGPRNISELPHYLRRFDCCIIPYKKNVLTASIYPLKINEYLAAGKPVVTTAFSDDIRSFAGVAYVADSDEQFIQQINLAIAENDANKEAARIAIAATNTWQKRVEQFWKLIT